METLSLGWLALTPSFGWKNQSSCCMFCGDVKERFLIHTLLDALFISVLQSLDQAARKDLTPIKLRAKAAKFAKDTVKNQMASFKVTCL